MSEANAYHHGFELDRQHAKGHKITVATIGTGPVASDLD